MFELACGGSLANVSIDVAASTQPGGRRVCMHKTLFAAQFVEWGSIDTPLLIITGLPKNEHLSTTLNQSLSDK